MKKRFLLASAAALIMAANVSAQTDITPSRYKFSNQEVGLYQIDYVNAGANPANALPAVVENFNNGFVMLAGAPPIYTGIDSDGAKTVQSGLNIVDLGGTVGKVLCWKGADCTYDKGIAMNSDFTDIRWFNLNFYTDPANTPYAAKFGEGDDAIEKAKIRVRLVFSYTQNVLNNNTLFKMYASTYSNDVVPKGDADGNGNHTNFRSSDFCLLDEDGDPGVDRDENMVYDPTRWMIYEFDTWAAAETGVPTRLKMEMQVDELKTGVLFIKELSFTTDITGEPVRREYVTYTPDAPDNIVSQILDKVLYSLDGDAVTFFEDAVIYTVSGAKIANVRANNAIRLDKGFYVAKVGQKSVKIAVK